MASVPAYYLYLPPTPIKARFVMLEESTQTFYDVDLATPKLHNPQSWRDNGISPSLLGATKLAIVIPNRLNADWKARLVAEGAKTGHDLNPNFEVGLLVSVTGQSGKNLLGTALGKVNICPFKPDKMSWDGLVHMKGPVLPDEMKNGLLGKLYGGIEPEKPFIHPDVLEKCLGNGTLTRLL